MTEEQRRKRQDDLARALDELVWPKDGHREENKQ